MRWWESVPIGSSDVTARWLRSDPPTDAELAQARAQIQASFATVRPRPAQRVIAVGGGATSLRTVAMAAGAASVRTSAGAAASSLPPGEEASVDRRALKRLLTAVAQLDSSALAQRFGIDMQRARLLAGGLLILDTVSELFEAPLELGRGGLREGLLLEGYQ